MPIATMLKLSHIAGRIHKIDDLSSAMAFNFTASGFDIDIFFPVNLVLNGFLILVVASTIVLAALCVIALLLAKTIKWQIKAIFLAADLQTEVGAFVTYVGYPIRVTLNSNVITCNIANGFFTMGFVASLTATTLYGIAVYIFIKHGISGMSLLSASLQHGRFKLCWSYWFWLEL